MSEVPTIREDEPLDEELVAYLDGELDAETSARVEKRLAEDPQYLQKLQGLQRSWDLLDKLPSTDVSEGFARTTVEMVAVSAAGDVEQIKSQRQQRRLFGWLCGAVACLAALMAGYAMVSWWVVQPNEALAADLPVIEHLDAYRFLDSPEDVRFLQALDEAGLFDEPEEGETELGVAVETAAPGEAIDTTAQLLADPASVPDNVKSQLQQRKEQFEALPAQEQTRFRQIHDALEGHPQSQRLRRVLLRYNAWLSELSVTERTELLSVPSADERLQEIRKIVQRQQQHRFMRYVQEALQEEDTEIISQWLNGFVDRNEDELLELARHPRRLLELEKERRRHHLQLIWRRHGAQAGLLPEQAELNELEQSLSPQARQVLQETDSEQQLEVIKGWLDAAISSRFSPSRDELEQFFHDLNPRERERLEKLPRDELREELSRMYHQRRRGPPRWPGSRPDRGPRSEAPRPETGADQQSSPAPPARSQGPLPPRRRPSTADETD